MIIEAVNPILEIDAAGDDLAAGMVAGQSAVYGSTGTADLPPSDAPLQLLTWLSPGFPIGSFAYSHGLEYAVGAHDVHDLPSATSWLAAVFEYGAPRNDLIVLSLVHRAACRDDAAAIASLNELCLAMAGSRERLLETTAQGNAFMTIIRDAWNVPAFARLARGIHEGDTAYPCAVGLASAAHDLPLLETLRAFSVATLQSLISAAIRLGAVGQTDGQRVVAALLPRCARLAQAAVRSTVDDLGASTFKSDIAAMKHETQYTRLFRS